MHQFGDDPSRSGLGIPAGQLHRGADDGISDVEGILKENEDWGKSVEYARKGADIDNALGLLQGLSIPGLSDAATMAGPAIKDSELGLPPGDPRETQPWESQIESYSHTHSDLTAGVALSYHALNAYVADNPDVVDRAWHGDGLDPPMNFFDDQGTLDWEKIREHPARFQSFYNSTELSQSSEKFLQNYSEEGGGSLIDRTEQPSPRAASGPPR